MHFYKLKLVIIISLIFTCFSFSQQTKSVDFKTAKVNINHISKEGDKVLGDVNYTFDVLKPVDSIYLDSENIRGYTIKLNDNDSINSYTTEDKLWIIHPFQPSENNHLHLQFEANPKKAIYAVGWNDNPKSETGQIWTQGQGKYTSNWLPSFDDVNEKVEFDLSITFDKDYKVLANGKLINTTENNTTKTWHYDMQQPMSSYLVAIAIGKYDVLKASSVSGVPIELYYYPWATEKAEPTYRYTKQIFDFFENEIGVPYPWQNFKQAPVHDFLYGGMENTSLTIFSDAYLVDDIGFNDNKYINTNAHELAHQWFGDYITATSGEHHWLQEGFATYYALLAERDIFGADYYYFELYKTAEALEQQNIKGQTSSLLNPKSTSLTFYQRGAWVLHMLREKVGDNIFKTAVKNYLTKFPYTSVATDNFIDEVELLHGKPLTEFVKLWIVDRPFPTQQAMDWLKENSSYVYNHIITDCEVDTAKCSDYLKYNASDDTKAKIIAQKPELVTKDTFKSSLKVRQAIAQHVKKIPFNLKSEYETLLNDKSLITIESALYNLWLNFPAEGSKYLYKTRNLKGLNNSLRILWLVLHLNTPEYQVSKKEALLKELINYTDNKYNAETRMTTFHYINLMKVCNAQCLANLEEAKTHHNWRMVKFAKKLAQEMEDTDN